MDDQIMTENEMTLNCMLNLEKERCAQLDVQVREKDRVISALKEENRYMKNQISLYERIIDKLIDRLD